MRQTLRFLLIVAILLITGASLITAQDVPPQLDLALADLSARLGQTISQEMLDSWEFSQARYTDTAFGCPFVTGEARPEGMLAYTFNLTYQGQTYEYRVALDNTLIFPCDQQLLNATPVVASQDDFEACPADFAGFVLSRLDIGARAQVDPEGIPLRLRRAPNTTGEQITLLNPGTVIEVLAGPSCGEGFVWWQIAAGGQVGWAAEGQTPDTYFIVPQGSPTEEPTATGEAAATAAPLLLATPTLPPTVTPAPGTDAGGAAPTTGAAELAGISNNMLTLYDIEDGGLRVVAEIFDAGDEFYPTIMDIAFSPNGDFLTFTARNNEGRVSLYVQPLDNNVPSGDPVEWAQDLHYAMPVTFTTDGLSVIYAKPGDTTQPSPEEVVNVYVHPLNSEGTPSLVGTFNFGTGCGGGSPFPGDALINIEAGYGRRGSVFEMTPYGLVYSTNCTGSGTALMNLENGQSVPVGTNLSRVRVSPDQKQLVGITDEQQGFGNGVITVVDLTAGLALTPLGAVAQADQLAWGPDGDIFYTTYRETGEIIPGSDQAPFTDMGYQSGVPLYDVTIHRIDLSAATDAEIYSGDAYSIGRILITPDGTDLFFTSIANGEAWAQNLATSEGVDTSTREQVAEWFGPTFNRLDLMTGQVAQFADSLLMPTLNHAALGGATPAATEG